MLGSMTEFGLEILCTIDCLQRLWLFTYDVDPLQLIVPVVSLIG